MNVVIVKRTDKKGHKSKNKQKDKSKDIHCVADKDGYGKSSMVRYTILAWLILTGKPCDSLLHGYDNNAERDD